MRVCFVPSWYPVAGDPVRGHFFAEHARALALEHDVVLVAPRRGTRLPAFVAEVVRRVRAERPDIVHAHVAVPAGLAALVARSVTGVPVVLTEHSGPLDRLFGRSRARRQLVRAIFQRVDALAVPSPMLEPELYELGVRRTLDLLPNPVPDRGSAAPRPLSFVAVGLMDDRTKGFEYLLEAWPRVEAVYEEARLRMIGDGRLLPEYARLARDARAERVTFAGRLAPDEVVEELRHADAYVSASIYETFGYALAEAASLGTPAVATSVGVAPSLIEPPFGIVVPPADVDALAGALVDFCNRRESFDRDGLRRRALERMAPAAVCQMTTTVYDRVLPVRRGRGGGRRHTHRMWPRRSS